LYQSTEDPTVFVFYENWESLEDIERHLESPLSHSFDKNTAGMLAKPEEITYLKKIK
jgi:quinol monooxygenase YgiN